jgi:replication factor C small subunit
MTIEENKSRRFNFTLWVEKYRPINIKSTLLPQKVKSTFNSYIEKGEVPNLLLYSSSPGVGKTTTAKALASDIGADYIYINTSSESGIDTLRTRISKFATTMSILDGVPKKKIAILDEFDGSTINLQNGLRAAIEEFHDSCRFIFTCNYITKIIEPLKSRCQMVDFNMTEASIISEMKPLVIKRLQTILKNEMVEFDQAVIAKLVEVFYPDIRKMLNLLQQYAETNKVIDSNIFMFSSVDNELYDLILNKKLTAARKFIIERNYNYSELYRSLFDNLVPKLPKETQGQAILTIASWHRDCTMIIDPEIHFVGCLLELISIF